MTLLDFVDKAFYTFVRFQSHGLTQPHLSVGQHVQKPPF